MSMPTPVAVTADVWNSRLWSVPLVQPPTPSDISMSGVVEKDVCACAIAVSARPSSTPLGVPSPDT